MCVATVLKRGAQAPRFHNTEAPGLADSPRPPGSDRPPRSSRTEDRPGAKNTDGRQEFSPPVCVFGPSVSDAARGGARSALLDARAHLPTASHLDLALRPRPPHRPAARPRARPRSDRPRAPPGGPRWLPGWRRILLDPGLVHELGGFPRQRRRPGSTNAKGIDVALVERPLRPADLLDVVLLVDAERRLHFRRPRDPLDHRLARADRLRDHRLGLRGLFPARSTATTATPAAAESIALCFGRLALPAPAGPREPRAAPGAASRLLAGLAVLRLPARLARLAGSSRGSRRGSRSSRASRGSRAARAPLARLAGSRAARALRGPRAPPRGSRSSPRRCAWPLDAAPGRPAPRPARPPSCSGHGPHPAPAARPSPPPGRASSGPGPSGCGSDTRGACGRCSARTPAGGSCSCGGACPPRSRASRGAASTR